MKSETEEKTGNSDSTGRGENGQSGTGNKTQNQGQTDGAGDNNKTHLQISPEHNPGALLFVASTSASTTKAGALIVL